jgi:hypothetical protein
MAVFWVVTPCSLVEVYRRFRGPCCLHHQGNGKLLPDYTALQSRRRPCSEQLVPPLLLPPHLDFISLIFPTTRMSRGYSILKWVKTTSLEFLPHPYKTTILYTAHWPKWGGKTTNQIITIISTINFLHVLRETSLLFVIFAVRYLCFETGSND